MWGHCHNHDDIMTCWTRHDLGFRRRHLHINIQLCLQRLGASYYVEWHDNWFIERSTLISVFSSSLMLKPCCGCDLRRIPSWLLSPDGYRDLGWLPFLYTFCCGYGSEWQTSVIIDHEHNKIKCYIMHIIFTGQVTILPVLYFFATRILLTYTYRITFAVHVPHCWCQNSPVQQFLIVYLFWSQSGKACVSFLIASPWRRPEPRLARPVWLQQLIQASGPWETGVLLNVPRTLALLHPSGSASHGRSSRQRRVAVCCGSCVKVSVCGWDFASMWATRMPCSFYPFYASTVTGTRWKKVWMKISERNTWSFSTKWNTSIETGCIRKWRTGNRGLVEFDAADRTGVCLFWSLWSLYPGATSRCVFSGRLDLALRSRESCAGKRG